MKYQDFCEMLNYGLSHDLIDAHTAVRLMCAEMPLTLHKGEFTIPQRGGVMVLNSRLVWWDIDLTNPGSIIQLRDLYTSLEGN